MPKAKTNLGKALQKKKTKIEKIIPEDAIFHHQAYEDPNIKFKALKSTLYLDPVSDLL
jgi:hypothetical protein